MPSFAVSVTATAPGPLTSVDTVIVIPNERIFTVVKHGAKAEDAFRVVDDVLNRAVKGISDVVLVRGRVNVDFADVKTVMANRGRAVMGSGVGRGESRAIDAAHLDVTEASNAAVPQPDTTRELEKMGRTLFFKLSYAWTP